MKARRNGLIRILLCSLLVSLLHAGATSSASASAGEGQPCGRIGWWSQQCDAGLRCDVRWQWRRIVLGVCVEEARTCGGLLGAACESNQFCDFEPEALCGAADQTGVCRDRPTVCTLELAPVCGCDDVTYDNACKANAAGVSVAREGSCEPIGCEYEGRFYEVGETFLNINGCSTCTCNSPGSVSCGVQCTCRYDDPAFTWYSENAQECLNLTFSCEEGEQKFLNQCGCGCFER